MEVFFASFVSFLSFFGLQPFANRVGLVDRPSERKRHAGTVPLVGGIAFYLATLTACTLIFPGNHLIVLYLISTALIVLLGSLDDFYDLSVKLRLLAQAIIASILVFGVGTYIHYLGDMGGFGPIDIGLFGTVLTIVAVIGAINAFNMVDGIDGLAGSLALNTFISVAVLFELAGQLQMVNLAVVLICSIVPFLLFNLGLVPGPVKKVFMGDAGSMFIGLSVIWLLTLGTQTEVPAFRTVTALWIIAVPLMDMAAIIIRRVRKGQSPFAPDRDHLHHIFVRAGFSPRQALMIIAVIAAVYSAIGICGDYYAVPEWVMFYGFLVMFAVYSYGIQHAWNLIRWVKKRREAT